jgi:defect-in-organelle-trafficking protein DotC
MKPLKSALLLSALLASQVAHAGFQYGSYDDNGNEVVKPYSLESLQDIDDHSPLLEKKSKITPVRYEALVEAALEVGAQGGLMARSMEINMVLDDTAELLDRQFPFYPLLIDGEILPPVILEARQTISQSDDGKTLRVADATYKIKQDARFVSAAPTWRDYLYMTQAGMSMPHKSVVPENDEEKALWRRVVKEGWQAGMEQADEIYELALNQLRMDYVGMVTFRKLLAENKVSKPVIERNRLGVTGNSREMAIGDRVAQIKQDTGFKINETYEWKSPVLPDEKPALNIQGKPIEDLEIKVVSENQAMQRQTVNGMLKDWISAWENADMTRYLSHYASDFVLPAGMSRNSWEARRAASIGRASVIEVEMQDLDIVISEDKSTASVSFDQHYQFGSSRGHVRKMMLLEDNGKGAWKIVYEAEAGPRKAK